MLVQLEQHCINGKARCIRVHDGNEARVDYVDDEGGADGALDPDECNLLLVGPCEGRSMSMSMRVLLARREEKREKRREK